MNKYRLIMLLLALFLYTVCGVSAQVQVGDVITFGAYEQDNDLTNGPEPVEWQVLAVEGERALLLSRYGLDVHPYNWTFEPVTWAEADLRQWLNGPFLEDSFSADEQSRIPEVLNTTQDHPSVGTEGGEDTIDRVFLLSIEDVYRLMPETASRTCEATPYAKYNGVYVDLKNGNSFWWLRSPGYSSAAASIVFSNGLVFTYGSDVRSTARLIRPALWLEF